MDNRERAPLKAREKSQVAVSVGLAIYARLTRLAHSNLQTVGEKGDYYVTLEQLENEFVRLRDELGEARAAIEGEPQPLLHEPTKHAPPCHCPANFCQAPRIMGRQMPCSRGRCETYTELCKCGSTAKIRFDCVLPKGHTADHAFRDTGRAERVLEAEAPSESPNPICPRCMGTGKYQRFPTEPQKDCSICNGTGRIAEEAPLPAAREPVNMLWSGTNSQGGSTGRVYSDPLMQKAYDEGREHGATISEGRLREALKPFAEFGQYLLDHPRKGISEEMYGWDNAVFICKSDLIRAAELARRPHVLYGQRGPLATSDEAGTRVMTREGEDLQRLMREAG